GLGSILTVIKEWKPHLIHRIKEAVRSSKKPRVLLVALDDSSAELALVRQYGLEELGTIFFHGRGKRYAVKSSDEKEEFFKLVKAINEVIFREGIQKLIVAGPGFVKERFAEFLQEKFPELYQKMEMDSVSSGGRAGLYEIVRRGTVERVSKEDRLSYETLLVEKLMSEIARSGLATYGKDEVKRAASIGSIKKLLVSDKLLRSGQVEAILEEVRKTRGDVVIISTEHDAGRQLLALGGLAALLRFRM
ncbi:MAG TPA: mRNA surveillance protein pelota, partial [Hadesarchaea archaeon]|nr:mRNA surveillance protein pelota [Hadesarchaea archaeon]